MSIDWITVSAQIINFLILVWLLKRFLYQPVLSAMARREERITNSSKEADERASIAEDQRQEFLEKTQLLEIQRDDLLVQAREAAQSEHRELLETARREVAESRTAWLQQLQAEKGAFLDQLKHTSADTMVVLARSIMSDLANAELENHIVGVFTAKLYAEAEQLRERLVAGQAAANITTSFELDERTRDRVIQSIRDLLGEDIEVFFARSDALICGIDLDIAGYRVSWNIADYLSQINGRITETLDASVSRG